MVIIFPHWRVVLSLCFICSILCKEKEIDFTKSQKQIMKFMNRTPEYGGRGGAVGGGGGLDEDDEEKK